MTDAETVLVKLFPNLASDNSFRETSPKAYYNCFAWAAGDDTRQWGPDAGCGNFWPPGVQRANTVQAFIAAYETLGFVPCPTGDLEVGFEKIAMFIGSGGEPEHVARQLESGNWTSKMGWIGIDIEHKDLASIEGDMYGEAKVFMRRPRT